MPVGDLSALNISRHGWFTVYFFDASDDVYILLTSLLLVIVAAGVYVLIRSGSKMSAFNQLLCEEDFSPKQAEENKKAGKITGIY